MLDDDADMGMLIESIALGATWLDYSLKGDVEAGRRLLGADCGYCQTHQSGHRAYIETATCGPASTMRPTHGQ